MHVKIFNTGKIEIPGIKTDELLSLVLLIIFSIFTNIPILSWVLNGPAELMISAFSFIVDKLLFFL